MSSPRRKPKPKVLLDEGLPPRRSFSKLNDYCDVKHVSNDLGKGGSTDVEVYAFACKQERILVVINKKHFRPRVKKDDMTIIGISAEFDDVQMDAKLLSKINNLKPNGYRGKYYRITR